MEVVCGDLVVVEIRGLIGCELIGKYVFEAWCMLNPTITAVDSRQYLHTKLLIERVVVMGNGS